MNEEIYESGNTEQQEIPIQLQFEVSRVADHPAPADTTQASTDADWAAQAEAMINANEEAIQDDDLGEQLELITPIECSLKPENGLSWSIIRRPHASEIFTLTDKPIIVPCYYMPMHHECGKYSGEAYFPMNTVLRDELKVPERALALHPGNIFPNTPFIFPQVLERRSSERNSRDTSLAAALSLAPGNWLRLWFDEETECFQHWKMEQDPMDAPEYAGFVWDCLTAIAECFHDESEHPLQIHIREQQRLHMVD